MTLDDWREVIELDLTGQFLCCREAAEAVRIGKPHTSNANVYGELMDSIYLANRYGAAITHEAWRSISIALMRSALIGAKKIPASGRCVALNSISCIRV